MCNAKSSTHASSWLIASFNNIVHSSFLAISTRCFIDDCGDCMSSKLFLFVIFNC